MSTLRKIEQALLDLSLDGYPIGPDWMRNPGWKLAYDTGATAIKLMSLGLAVAGLYLLGVRAVLWISDLTQ